MTEYHDTEAEERLICMSVAEDGPRIGFAAFLEESNTIVLEDSQANGYDTQVFEFISLEHTSKNKMILAQKRKLARDDSNVLVQIKSIKEFYSIKEHCLETLLETN